MGYDQCTTNTSNLIRLVSRFGQWLISNADLQLFFFLSTCTSNHFSYNAKLSQDEDPVCSWPALLWLWFQQYLVYFVLVQYRLG